MRYNAKSVINVTFKELIAHKSIDKITVTEICEISGINRQTFYNHYAGLFDIFKYLFKKELFSDIDQDRTLDTWHGGFLATLHYLKRNSDMMMHVYDSTYRSEANAYFNELSSELMRNVMKECMMRKQITLEAGDTRFIVNFYRHVFNGLMMDWVNEGMKDEPEILLRRLQVMLDGSIIRYIEIFADKEKHHWLN